MRFLIAHLLESISYFLYFGSLLYWARRDKRGIIKILSGYYFLACIFIIKATLVVGTTSSNIAIYSLLCVISSLSLGAYFYNILQKPWKKVLVLLLCAANGIYYVIINLIQDGQVVLDSLAYVVLSASVVILIFMYMHQLLSEVNEDPLSMNFDFWFVSSQLLYYMGAFAIFLTFGYLTKKAIQEDALLMYSAALTWLWGIHNVLLFLSALLTSGSIAWISYHRKSQ